MIQRTLCKFMPWGQKGSQAVEAIGDGPFGKSVKAQTVERTPEAAPREGKLGACIRGKLSTLGTIRLAFLLI